MEFCKCVAVMMNDRFQANHRHVPLDATKVRMKLDRFQGYWEVQPSGSKKMVFAPLLLILCRFVC